MKTFHIAQAIRAFVTLVLSWFGGEEVKVPVREEVRIEVQDQVVTKWNTMADGRENNVLTACFVRPE